MAKKRKSQAKVSEVSNSAQNNKDNPVADLFNQFIEHTIIGRKSFLNDSENIISCENLTKIKSLYIENSIKSVESGDQKAINLAKKLRKKKLTFADKIKEQFECVSDQEKELFNNLIYLRYLPIGGGIKKTTKLKAVNVLKEYDENNIIKKFPEGIAGYGYKLSETHEEMVFLINLFIDILSCDTEKNEDKDNTGSEVGSNLFESNSDKGGTENNIKLFKDKIKNYCLQNSNKLAIRSMLLHLCDSENYEPIASFGDKVNIVKGLGPIWLTPDVWEEIKYSYNDLSKIDEYLKNIKEAYTKKKTWPENGFYSPEIEEIWKNSYVANAFEILTNYQKQIILYGAPGTGKTFNAKKIINEFLTNDENNQEFVESIKKGEDENEFDLKKIKFSTFEEKEQKENTEEGKQIKSFAFKKDDEIFKKSPFIWEIVQFNQSYSYEDFIEGLRPTNSSSLEPVDGIFKRFVEIAKNHVDKKFIFIIDEINRGKIDKIFGELLYLLEYRDESVRLHYSGDDFSIPENLFIVGTMNTADKSLALLDVALRRRFWFVRCEPKAGVLKDEFKIDKSKIEGEDTDEVIVKKIALKLFELVNGENNEGGILEKLGDDAQELKIGHSYFLKLIPEDKESEPSFSDLKNIWFYSIIPLLEEYCGFNKSMLSGLFTNKVKVDLSKKEIFILENLIGI